MLTDNKDPLRIFLFDGEEPGETVREFWERKERRIEATKRPSTVNLIKAVERAHDDEYGDVACDKIGRMMRMPIQSKVKYWSSRARYGGIRLYPDDFEEVFWEVLQTMVLEDYRGGDFWLYENILKRIDSRALDLIRWAKRDRRKHEHMAVSLEAILDMPDPRTSCIEEDVANRELVFQMMVDTSLDEREHQLLWYLYDDPEVSLQKIATDLGLRHRETARRMMKSLKAKIAKYEQFLKIG